MTASEGTVTAETVSDLLGLNEYVQEQLQKQDADLEAAYRVLKELHEITGSTELYRLLTSHYVVSGIHRRSFDATVRSIQLLVLPYANEFIATSEQTVHAALTGLLMRAEHWHQYQNTFFEEWMKLSRDPLMIRAASNELRVIAAVERSGLPREVRDRVISRNNSPKTLLLSMNTPLDLLLRSRPDSIDGIIRVIDQERETDGDRIAAILDSAAPVMASGVL